MKVIQTEYGTSIDILFNTKHTYRAGHTNLV